MFHNKAIIGSVCRSLRSASCIQTPGKSYRRLLSVTCQQWKGEHVTVDSDASTGVSVLTMNKKPVNGLNLEFLTNLNITLEKLENDSTVRGLILTSALPTVFSAGLDILEMYQPQPERLAEFWRNLQDVWLKLYGSNLITIAAINGHAPAGGCLLSMCCDYRVMSLDGNYMIGLNETLLGIVAPFWFKDTFVSTVGQRVAEYGLQLGKMYSSQEAMMIGLVDQLVPQAEVVQAAKTEMSKWLKIPDHARVLTKMSLRKPTIEKLQSRKEEDIENFVNFCTKDSIQKSLGIYLANLKKKK